MDLHHAPYNGCQPLSRRCPNFLKLSSIVIIVGGRGGIRTLSVSTVPDFKSGVSLPIAPLYHKWEALNLPQMYLHQTHVPWAPYRHSICTVMDNGDLVRFSITCPIGKRLPVQFCNEHYQTSRNSTLLSSRFPRHRATRTVCPTLTIKNLTK